MYVKKHITAQQTFQLGLPSENHFLKKKKEGKLFN